MKHKLITITALAAALSTLASCRQEEAPSGLNGPLDISLEIAESPLTKVDVDGNSGACTWTSGDQIGIFVVNESEGNAYHPVTVNTTSNTVHLPMTPEMSLSGYAVSPYLMRDDSDPDPTGATPRVHYLTEYSMSGVTLTAPGFSYIPMMAVNNASLLSFYHVGGLLRLILSNVPENTNKIAVEFVDMAHVCGKCTVTKPGTRKATTAITTGEGNTVTFTDVTRSASTMYLNVPLPSIDFSDLTAIRIRAYQGSTLLAVISKSTGGSWGQLKHGYGRMLDADFAADALSGVRLSSDASITLWKSKTVTRTATALDQYGLPYDDVTMVWSSSDETVATVDASSGLVTAVGPGETTITATATPATGGTPYSNNFTVYVNTFSVSSVAAAKTTIEPGATTSVTATLTHTNYGTVLSFPGDLSVAWTSSAPTYVTVSSPSSVNVGTLQSVTTATGGTAGSSSTITASVPNYGTATADCSITCKLVADLTFPSGGEKYKFRGYYMHPGSLYWNGSSFSITDGTDPLEIVTHFATEGTPPSGSNRFYLTWTELSSVLGTTNGVITGTVHADDAATGNHDWRIPTFTSTTEGELAKILSDEPDYPIQINSTDAVSTNARNYLFVNVKLPTNIGLGYWQDNSGSSVGNKAYQAGMLLVPDGAHLTCPGMNSSSGHGNSDSTTASTTYNVIDYDDLLILVAKGCVFLPAAGRYDGGWNVGGYYGYCWSASQNNGSNAYALYFRADSFNVLSDRDKSYYYPVRVVRQ